MFDAEYRTRSHWGHMSANYHDGCVEAYKLWKPDVFVILQDDFVITPRWFNCLQHFWDKNWDKPVGSAGFRFAEAWEEESTDQAVEALRRQLSKYKEKSRKKY